MIYLQSYINYTLTLFNIEAWINIASNKSHFFKDLDNFFVVLSGYLNKALVALV